MTTRISETYSSNTMRRRDRMLQKVLLIRSMKTLTTTIEQCIQALNYVDDGIIFMISSEALGQYVVPSIQHMARAHTIYLLCGDAAEYEGWA